MERIKRKLMISFIIVLIVIASYLMLVFSNITFISKWRTIYIETAMTTMTHQWLATAFIPRKVINKVLENRTVQDDEIAYLVEKWGNVRVFKPEEVVNVADNNSTEKIDTEQDKLLSLFHEINTESFTEYIAHNNVNLDSGYEKLVIDESKAKSSGPSIKTIQGDNILVLDAVNGILIVEVEGEGFRGRLALVKDAGKVKLASAGQLGNTGDRLRQIMKSNKAILGINASGFKDTNWEGNGGTVVGMYIKDGKMIEKPYEHKAWVMIGFDYDNNLRIGSYKDTSIFRDAVQFTPPLVLNGERVVKGTAGYGLQPRTSIGQTRKGEVMLLTIDGRQPGWSVGATMEQCIDVMLRYEALQAAALDGGSSTTMIYNNEVINRPAGSEEGRRIPNAFIVMPTSISIDGE